jgi:hypothetical protein
MTGVSASGDPVCGSTEGTRWDTENCFDDVELSPAQNGWTTLCTIALSKSHEFAHTQQWAVSAVIQLRNSADLALQDNTRTVKCEIGHPETGDSFSRNRVSLLGHEGYGTLHMLDDKSATTAAVRCNVERSGDDRSYVYSEKVTILARDLGPICGGAPLDCPR